MTKKHKYLFYRNRKEILNKYGSESNWFYANRNNILRHDDGLRWLLYEYLDCMVDNLLKMNLPFPSQYYLEFNHKGDRIHFKLNIPLTKESCRDSYLESISVLKVDFADGTHSFRLNKEIIKGTSRVGTLTLLYTEQTKIERRDE